MARKAKHFALANILRVIHRNHLAELVAHSLRFGKIELIGNLLSRGSALDRNSLRKRVALVIYKLQAHNIMIVL